MRLAPLICCVLTGLAAAQTVAAEQGGAPRAEGLADPTRPPNAGPGAAGEEAAVSGPELQSVLISPMRSLAVIDGQTVLLGGKFRDATVSRISASGVELRSGSQVEVLRLFPRVEIKSRPSDEPRRRN